MNNISTHMLFWIGALILAILSFFTADFPALTFAVIAGAVGELIGD